MPLSSTLPHLNYRLEGAGPDLVLIHGVGSRLTDWDGVVGRLGAGYRILRFDLRGHGGSDAPPGPYQIEDLCGDLTRLMDELEMERAHIAGFSLGGLVAQGLAISSPERVNKLVLLSTVAGRSDEERGKVEGRLEFIRSSHPADYFDQSVERWFTPGFRASNPDIVARRKAAVTAMDGAAYAAAYYALAMTDFADQLSQIRAPTLVATGEHDIGSNPRMARFMSETIPGAKLEILPELRHSILLEAPGIVAELVLGFLKEESEA
ncbi:MAG: alpha/beta fold hydrolase [Pseudomonadota bacterium]